MFNNIKKEVNMKPFFYFVCSFFLIAKSMSADDLLDFVLEKNQEIETIQEIVTKAYLKLGEIEKAVSVNPKIKEERLFYFMNEAIQFRGGIENFNLEYLESIYSKMNRDVRIDGYLQLLPGYLRTNKIKRMNELVAVIQKENLDEYKSGKDPKIYLERLSDLYLTIQSLDTFKLMKEQIYRTYEAVSEKDIAADMRSTFYWSMLDYCMSTNNKENGEFWMARLENKASAIGLSTYQVLSTLDYLLFLNRRDFAAKIVDALLFEKKVTAEDIKINGLSRSALIFIMNYLFSKNLDPEMLKGKLMLLGEAGIKCLISMGKYDLAASIAREIGQTNEYALTDFYYLKLGENVLDGYGNLRVETALGIADKITDAHMRIELLARVALDLLKMGRRDMAVLAINRIEGEKIPGSYFISMNEKGEEKEISELLWENGFEKEALEIVAKEVHPMKYSKMLYEFGFYYLRNGFQEKAVGLLEKFKFDIFKGLLQSKIAVWTWRLGERQKALLQFKNAYLTISQSEDAMPEGYELNPDSYVAKLIDDYLQVQGN